MDLKYKKLDLVFAVKEGLIDWFQYFELFKQLELTKKLF